MAALLNLNLGVSWEPRPGSPQTPLVSGSTSHIASLNQPQGRMVCLQLQCLAGLLHPMEIPWQYQFRIILLGDSTVGKSSLLRRYTEGIFVESGPHTVGVDFSVHFVEVEPGVQVKLQFWDTAGQERFR